MRFAASSRGVQVPRGTLFGKQKRMPVAHREVARRASAAGQSEDPYSVLGVRQGADSAAVEKAYRNKKRQAEMESDQAALKRIEAAHNSLFMASLSSRLSGSGPVDKAVAQADRTDLAPWRPRVFRAPDTLLRAAAAVYGIILAWNFLLMAVPDGVVTAAMAGIVFNTWKQYALFPPNASADLQKRLDSGWRNLFRSALLTALATFLGVAVLWSVPDAASDALNLTLPILFYESQAALTTLGAIVSNFLFTWWLR